MRDINENLEPEHMVELIDSFLDTAPATMESMAKSMDAGDFPAAARSAHTVRGSLGSLGMRRLEVSVREVETRLRTGSHEISNAELDRIHNQFEAGCAVLREHRQRLVSGVKESARSESRS